MRLLGELLDGDGRAVARLFAGTADGEPHARLLIGTDPFDEDVADAGLNLSAESAAVLAAAPAAGEQQNG